MTLFTGGYTEPFGTVTITKDGTPLTEGTGLNQYTLDYVGGDGSALELNNTGLVLSVNVAGAVPPGTVIMVR